MTEDSPENRSDESVWGTKARIAVGSIAILTVIAMACLWFWSHEISHLMLSHRGLSSTEARSFDNQARWGDSYGATNALFSGIAMVAAITAVAFQVIELGGQRQEIRLQLKEMKDANATNEQRLKLDQQVHGYERSLAVVNLSREFNSDAIVTSRQQFTSLLAAEYSFNDICIAAFNRGHEAEMLSSIETALEKDIFTKWTRLALGSEPFLHHLSEVASLDLSLEEIAPWAYVAIDHKDLLAAFVSGACECSDAFHPSWERGVTKLLSRVYPE